jgi:ribosomal protein S18 acetylase RimI-like enzyme
VSTGPTFEFRPIQESDQTFLAELYASTRAEEMAQVPWPPEAIRAFLRDQFRLQHHHYTTHNPEAAFELVLMDGVPVGRRYVARGAKEIRLMDIALLPAYRGHGLGRNLMATILEESDQKGLPVSLHVERNNFHTSQQQGVIITRLFLLPWDD